MAGDWIKVEDCTPDKPEVFRMADALKIDPDAVTGKLIRIWIWADQQTSDGSIAVARGLIDRLAGTTGFATAMQQVGWLEEHEGMLLFPNFENHNGQSAKRRAQNAKRQATHRNRNANRNAAVTPPVTGGHKKRNVSRAVKRDVLERDSHTCLYCGRAEGAYQVGFEVPADASLSVDHVIPESCGGDESLNNLVTCCMSCNRTKNNRTPDEAGMPWPKMRDGSRYGVRYGVRDGVRDIGVTREEKRREEKKEEKEGGPLPQERAQEDEPGNDFASDQPDIARVISEERELLERWHATPGTRPYKNNGQMSTILRSLLRAVLESGYDWRDAIAKFPLPAASGWQQKPGLRWFLTDDHVERVIQGDYDFSDAKKNPTGPTSKWAFGSNGSSDISDFEDKS